MKKIDLLGLGLVAVMLAGVIISLPSPSVNGVDITQIESFTSFKLGLGETHREQRFSEDYFVYLGHVGNVGGAYIIGVCDRVNNVMSGVGSAAVYEIRLSHNARTFWAFGVQYKVIELGESEITLLRVG